MPNKSDQAYRALRDRLLSGAILPGTRLAEQALSKELGVNRGDVRQAFSRLYTEGLVDRGAKGGVFAKILTPDEIREMYEVRCVLETAAVGLVARRARPQDFAELEELISHMRLMAENNYTMGVYEADLRFHTRLVKAAHNKKLLELYSRANLPLTGVHIWKHDLDRVQGKPLGDVEEHARIVEHLKRRETAAALELLRRSYQWIEDINDDEAP